jgi:hypothetical protein
MKYIVDATIKQQIQETKEELKLFIEFVNNDMLPPFIISDKLYSIHVQLRNIMPTIEIGDDMVYDFNVTGLPVIYRTTKPRLKIFIDTVNSIINSS